MKICISLFVCGLPLVSAFTILRATLPERLAGIAEADLGAFITLMETVLDIDTIFRSASQSQGSRPGHPPVSTPIMVAPPSTALPPSATLSPSSAVADAGSRFAKPALVCGNCKSRGLRCTSHTDATCFQPGGGMEGHWEEYLSNKGRFHAMFVECLDNASLLLDSPIPPDPPSAFSPSLPPTLDDDVILAPLANLCVPTFPNTDFDFDLYHLHAPSSSLSRFAFSSFDFSTSALASMVSLYNALLDSGCTHHIVRDRSLFSLYVSSPVSVGTANCGSLEALGTGDVSFRYPYRDRHVLFTLRGCLYAPEAPINLLSVGALVERGMSCLFSPGGITKVFFSGDHPLLPGLEFCATEIGRAHV